MGKNDPLDCISRIIDTNTRREGNKIVSSIVSEKKISTDRILKVVIAVTMLCSIGPFFVWENFLGGFGFTLFQVLRLVTVVCLCVTIDWRHIRADKFGAALGIFTIYLFLALFTGVKGGTYLPILAGNVLTFGTFSLLTMAKEDVLSDSFDILKTLFTVILAYTLVIFVFVVIGIPIPATSLQSAESGRTLVSGQSYLNYLGCLFIRSRFILRMDRFTSMFTEPGVVGTIAAFYLAASDFDLKSDKRNVVLLISGICSLSLAFIFLVAILLVVRGFRKGAYKVAGVMALLIILYIVFMNINFSNQYISSVQYRLTLTEAGLAGENRINDYAQAQYESFLHSDLKTVLLGYGNAYVNPSTNINFWQGSATYKRQIFQYGFVGFGIYVLWMMLAPYRCYRTEDKEKNKKIISYIIVFIASLYQRPQLTSLFFIYFLLAGCVTARNISPKDRIAESEDNY